MKFSMVSGDVLKLECGALVVGIPAGGLTPTAEALDKASEGAVSRWIEAGDIHPCVGKVAVFRDFPGCKAERVVFVGLGKCKARDFQRVLKLGIDNAYLGKEVVLTTLEWLPDEVPEWIAEQSGFIACTALDRPKNYKTFDINWKKPKNIDLYVPDENKDVEKAYAEGVSVGVGAVSYTHLWRVSSRARHYESRHKFCLRKTNETCFETLNGSALRKARP